MLLTDDFFDLKKSSAIRLEYKFKVLPEIFCITRGVLKEL